MRKLVVLTALIGGLLIVPSANAAITSVFPNTPFTSLNCTVQPAHQNIRLCGVEPNGSGAGVYSVTGTFDGVTPIDTLVTFPADPGAGDDNWPLVMIFHGYGGQKLGLSSMDRWLNQGYAVMSITDRGFGKSCGSQESRATLGATACENGYNHLQDSRYEVRDAQFLASELVGQGLVDPDRIGATGGSYGGGKSMALAALKNRVMNANGTLSPWTVPAGSAFHAGDTLNLAAAAPEIPWSDLSYSLVPNGSTLDYVTDNPYRGRIGVQKSSFVFGLYLSGCSAFAIGDPGATFCSDTDPQANLKAWKARLDQGEPYDGDATVTSILNEIQSHHSSYYIDHSTVAPAPVLMSSGWTDDLFPADETLRFYNRTRAQYPNDPISLMYLDYGHMRGQNKAADTAKLAARENDWFAKYVKGNNGPTPFQGVETITQTCPSSAPSAGPFFAPSWDAIHPGEVRMTADTAQTILPTGGSTSISQKFDPIVGDGACATAPAANQTGTANYRMPAATGGGYTLMGSPTIIADFTLPGANSQVAARLLDVAPNGTENLVARGLWRPQVTSTPVTQVFQLHPNGYKFADGHVAKLELLPKDQPYGQISKGQADVTIANLELRLPVLDNPGAAGGAVLAPLPHFFPGDTRPGPTPPASGRATVAKGKLLVNGKFLKFKVSCPASVASCPSGKVTIKGAPKKGKKGRFVVARGSFSLTGGQSKRLNLKITGSARKYFKKHKSLRTQVTVTNQGTSGSLKAFRGLRVKKAPSY